MKYHEYISIGTDSCKLHTTGIYDWEVKVKSIMFIATVAKSKPKP